MPRSREEYLRAKREGMARQRAANPEAARAYHAHLDHILSPKRGGTNAIGNLQWTCEIVNLAKRDLTNGEFLALCSNVCMRWIGRRIDLVEEAAAQATPA